MKAYNIILCALSTLLAPLLQAQVPGQWRIHNSNEQYPVQTIDTPERVYALVNGHINFPHDAWNTPTGQLFVFDKDSREVIPYNRANYLNHTQIDRMAYNPDGHYLLIVYTDSSIDLLYDDDTTVSIPGLYSAILPAGKGVNDITFDPASRQALLATSFGMAIIDDKKHVISKSRVYDTPLTSVARTGDHILAGTPSWLGIAPSSARLSSLSDYTAVPLPSGVSLRNILPLTASTFALLTDKGVYKGSIAADGAVTLDKIVGNSADSYARNKRGYFLRNSSLSMQLTPAGDIEWYNLEKISTGTQSGSWDMKTFYFLQPLRGLQWASRTTDGQWTELRPIPFNAPQVYAPFTFSPSSEHGMVIANSGYNRFYDMSGMDYWGYASGYKEGTWTSFGAYLTDGPLRSIQRESSGAVTDPRDPDILYMGTRRNGLLRIDMRDDSMQAYVQQSHSMASRPDVHTVFPTSDKWTEYCNVSVPTFDSDGTLWTAHNPSHVSSHPSPLYYWTAADRAAGNVSAFRNLPIRGYRDYQHNILIKSLTTQANRNILVFGYPMVWDAPLCFFSHRGTLQDTSDDIFLSFDRFIDQDGNTLSRTNLNSLVEDPATGLLWVACAGGVYTVDPAAVIRSGTDGTLQMRRVKVARGDGTNLADYLLDGADVTDVAIDPSSDKWFATAGSGILRTSADGTQVLGSLTPKNSLLPSDIVFALRFDPASNALWIGTDKGCATLYTASAPPADNYKDITAFPNPVRPEYLGPVTIQGLMQDSLVKITDSSGALVAELGTSQGGMMQWDLLDMHGRPVGPGVYYVVASTTSPDAPSRGGVAKILVIR